MDFSTQQLRQQLLSHAIQGKLVPQIAAEGNAKDLLQKIEAERKKSNSKYKPLPPVTDEEKPFEIPESWVWVRLGDVSNYIIAGGDKPRVFSKEKNDICNIPVYSNGEKNNGLFGYTNTPTVKDNCVTISARGTIGFSCVRTHPFCPIVRLICINPVKQIDIQYLNIIFKPLLEMGNGTSIPQLTVPMISPKLLPLPPLAEQKRIVEKLEELLGELDTIEQTKEQIEHYAEQLQGQILQTAIQGKLVPQIASEGNAQDLLHKIEAERKKSNPKYKPLPPVTDEEKPFEIPESWVWCRIEHISNSIFYGVSESAKASGEYKLLRITDIQSNRVNWNSVPFTNFDKTKVSSYLLKKGDILFARTGGTVGKSYLVDECPSNSIFASYLIRVQPSALCYSQYIKRFFESPLYWEQILDKANGSGQPNCNGTKLANLLIPLPPLSEQKRIVAKLEELLGEVEKLKR